MIKNTICFVAGRSGGHLIPALTLAKQKKKKKPKTKILFFSTNTQLDKKITSNTQTIDWHVPLTLENIPGKKLYRYPFFFWNFLRSFFIAFNQLRKKKPNKIISTGGYIALPVACAAKLLNIPLYLYELNVIPGKTTKFLTQWAKKIHICFSQSNQFLPQKKCILTPYPNRFIKTEIKNKKTILNALNFCPNKKTVLVLGGSQGSLFLNKLVGNYFINNSNLKNKIQLIHQTGSVDKTDWALKYKKSGIDAIVFDFCDDIKNYYQIADLVICRSGAGSLFETLFFKKPCITIPLETKQNNHQLHNAKGMQKMHPKLFTVVRQNKKLEKLSKILNHLILEETK